MKDKCIRKMFLFTILFCVFFFLISVEDACAEDIISKGGSSISETLTLPADTSVIEDYAFYGCTSLTGSLNIPASVTSIGDYAFANCNGLTGRLTVPENVKSIGEGAFIGCNQFDKVFVQVSQADGTMISVERTAVYCSPNSYAWSWAEEQDDFEPVAISVWPERAIQLIVPENPGSDTDANARALAAALIEEMGWPVIVVNMVGGSGSAAFDDCLANPSDGYRFVFYHNSACIIELLDLYNFNVLDDFKLAGLPILDNSNAFIINSQNEKFSDLQSLVTYMKVHPGEVTFAAETNSFAYIQALAFEEAAGVQFQFIDVGTTANKITELLNNRVDVIGIQAGLVRDYVTTHQFKVLSVLAEDELQLDDILLPTCMGQGYNVVFSKFFYLAAPNCVDDGIINIMNEGLTKAIKNVRFQEYTRNALLNLTNMTPAEAESYYQDQYELYASYLLE